MILVAGIAAVLIAVACLAYYIVLGFWVGFGVNFGMIWPAASAVFAGIAALCRRARKGRRVPAWLWIPGLVLMSVGAAGFLWIESRILTAGGISGILHHFRVPCGGFASFISIAVPD